MKGGLTSGHPRVGFHVPVASAEAPDVTAIDGTPLIGDHSLPSHGAEESDSE